MDSLFLYIRKNYAFDAKILSISRILIATIIMMDLFFRYQNFEAHYTNKGVLPADVIKIYYPFYQYYFSLHNLFSDIIFQKVLFGLHFVFTLLLLLGYKTKWSTIINFILLLSLHHRNPLVLQGGDDLLRITLFYMIFLPWGKFFSIDFLLSNPKSEPDTNDFSWIYLVFYWNIAMVYFFSALLKQSSEWQTEGSAIYYALSLNTLRVNFLGNFIYHHYLFSKILTFIVYYGFEILIPLILIFSFNKKIRTFAALSIIALHLFILMSLKVGIFPYVGISTALMLLPPTSSFSIRQISFNKSEFYFALILLIFIVRFNIATLNLKHLNISIWEDRLLNSIGLAQRWNMFSPGVKKYEGWLILRGIKNNHAEWDLIHNTDKINDRKNNYLLTTDRWRKFLENYEQRQYNFIKPYFCKYLIEQWNEQHPENTIKALNILFMKKETININYQFVYEKENLCLCND